MAKQLVKTLVVLLMPVFSATAASSSVERLVERLTSWDLEEAIAIHVARFEGEGERETLIQMLEDLEARLGENVKVEECQVFGDGRHQCILRGAELAIIKFSVVAQDAELQFGNWDITFQ